MSGHATRQRAKGDRPTISVVVPVLNGMEVLPRCVEALAASDLPRRDWELIVVDDGSTDGTHGYAETVADRLLRVDGGPRGPAWARNRGAEVARGDTLVFLDADVCAHPDTLRRFAELLEEHPEVSAIFGAYDDEPAAPGFLSQYRNLYHRYVHLRGSPGAETFWAGCGAVRRSVFLSVGGFDTGRFTRPQVEDIELGYRLGDAGHRILLDPGVQGKHLKRWTLGSILRTDLLDRGIPWVLLLLGRRGGREPEETLNADRVEKIKTALMGVTCVCAAAVAVFREPLWLLAALSAIAIVIFMNLPAYRWFSVVRGWPFALRAVPVNLLHYLIIGLAVVIAYGQHLSRGAYAGPLPEPLTSAPGPRES